VLGLAFSVFAGVMLCRFVMMVFRIEVVTVRDVGVMSSFFVLAGRVMLCGFLVMVRGMPAMVGSVAVMLGGFLMIGHCCLLPI
jgi:hypothetical protein